MDRNGNQFGLMFLKTKSSIKSNIKEIIGPAEILGTGQKNY
jgi:hypothetical protein